jgi:hypothetical protein
MQNGERHAHIASRLAACALGTRLGTRRKRGGLRLGKRDVQGGEDDWEGEGELKHVCRCWRDGTITPWGGAYLYVRVWRSFPQCHHATSMYTSPLLHVNSVVESAKDRTRPSLFRSKGTWRTEDKLYMSPGSSVVEPDKREGTRFGAP